MAKLPPILLRDGTSQPMRRPAALDPGHARVDERSVQDLLAFASEYGEKVVYYNHENERDVDFPHFGEFIDPKDVEGLAKLVEDPEAFVEERLRLGLRPHLALFLAFVKLLGHAQDQLNTVTARHLHFYLRDVLGMTSRPFVADRAYVLPKLARNADQALLPAGTLLDGGKDSLGKDRAYRTDRDIVVSRAEIAQIASIFVERDVTTLGAAWRARKDDAKDALLAMLELALGDPMPGDSLPAYKRANVSTIVDMTLLEELATRVTYSSESLHLQLHELDDLLSRFDELAAEDADWTAINNCLTAVALRQTPPKSLVIADPKAFATNLTNATGFVQAPPGLLKVVSIEDVFIQRNRKDVSDYIKDVLRFETVAIFESMMTKKIWLDAQWSVINQIIELAGRRKQNNPTYMLPRTTPYAFDKNLESAVGLKKTVAEIREYRAELFALEEAFRMTPEDFSFMMTAVLRNADPAKNIKKGPTDKEWHRLEEMLDRAHGRKVEASRRARFKALGQKAITPEQGLRLVLLEVVGPEQPGETLVLLAERVCDNVASVSDAEFLRERAKKAPQDLAIRDMHWERIVDIVEQVRQLKGATERPIARKISRVDIHPYADATSVAASLGIDSDRDTPRWETFGVARERTNLDSPRAPSIGFSVASPLLELREGKRKVVLTLGFRKGFHIAHIERMLSQNPFEVAISTAKGFQNIATFQVVQGKYRQLLGFPDALPNDVQALQISFELGTEKEPVAALPSEATPALQVLLRPISLRLTEGDDQGKLITSYDVFGDLVLDRAHVSVRAEGLAALALENDRSVLDPKKPFEPFGSSPSVGSRFRVGHPELCEKRLDTLKFYVEWMKVPEKPSAHYTAYGFTTPLDFRARIALIDRRRELTLDAAAPLFAYPDARVTQVISIDNVRNTLNGSGFVYAQDPESGTQDDRVSTWPRSFVFELYPTDFQHDVYPRIAAQKAALFAAAVATTAPATATFIPEAVNPTTFQVPAPYTPLIKRFTVDYSASADVSFNASVGAGDIRIRHIHPFGSCFVNAKPGQDTSLFPRYDEFEGELYIGLRGVRAPQRLSMLFQVAEGSANADIEPSPLTFSYLSADGWQSLHDGHLLADGTRGFQGTGIVELSLPEAAPSNCMPPGLTWLRVAVRGGATSVCDIVAIHPHAVPVTFVDRGNAPDHYAAALPPGTIKKPFQAVRGIAGVEQPYPSFGGKLAEREEDFQVRATERLRHKQRALSVWDYERLVLERFPEIYRVKCVPAGDSEQSDVSVAADEIAAAMALGRVTLVVIPDIRDRIPFDPFEPKASAATLAAVGDYLADKLPPGARLTVRNAHFTAVRVRMIVQFLPGSDEGFYKKKLADEICRFLSPWAYDDGAEITMGGRIYAGAIIDFVDRRPYVDYVERITLLRRDEDEFVPVPRPTNGGGYFVEANRPDGVLVAAREHEIETHQMNRVGASGTSGDDMGDSVESGATRKGIGVMSVERDFIVFEPGAIEVLGVDNMIVEEDFQVS